MRQKTIEEKMNSFRIEQKDFYLRILRKYDMIQISNVNISLNQGKNQH